MIDFNKNSLYFGMGLALVSPFFGFAIATTIVETLVRMDLIDPSSVAVDDRRMRTILLFAICTNIIWIRYYNKAFLAQTLRGVVISTMILSALWFVKYYSVLYSS